MRLGTSAALLSLLLPILAAAQDAPDLDEIYKGLRREVAEQARPLTEPRPVSPAGAKDPLTRIVSWNIQTWGSNVKEGRRQAYQAILGHMFSEGRSAQVLAVQEVAHAAGAENFTGLLPGGADRWNLSFEDSKDSQDNGFYTLKGVEVDCDRLLFLGTGTAGEEADKGRSLHPARMAHVRVGDFDFTIITLHLTYQDGDADASKRELKEILKWLEGYFATKGHDPDVILVGDFNLPTRRGKSLSNRASEGGWMPVEDILEEHPLFRRELDRQGRRKAKATELTAFVDELTSRHQGEPANNYDHFIVSGDLLDEEFIQGSAGPIPANFLHAVEKEKGVYVSDHYPISAGFRTGGKGNNGRKIKRDGLLACPL